MAKPSKRNAAQRTSSQTKADAQPVPIAPGLHIAGLVLLAVAVFASGMLVWQHFSGASLPGCGEGSPCAQATGSAWGKLPLIDWPVSFVGLAYFIAMMVGWWSARRGELGILPWIARLGAVVSVLFVGVMVWHRMLCPYCIVSHLGNLGFLIMLEFAASQQPASSRPTPLLSSPIKSFATGLVAVTIVLGGWQVWLVQQLDEQAERDLDESTAEMVAGGSEDEFTGRYLTGPADAPARIVAFTNYQCGSCRQMEQRIDRVLASRDDVSLSIKHFPASTDCNRHASRNMHPNSCLAARAAEAAGIIGGNERFWEMHHWLFNREGSFTEPELRVGVTQMGYNFDEFRRVMMGDETLRRVQEDIEEAVSVGLHYTPMIFINGVELRGWSAPNAIDRAVQRIVQSGGEPEIAQPPTAFEKYIADWRDGNLMPRYASPDPARSLGPDDAPVRVDMWLDYQSDRCVDADAEIRQRLESRSNVQYVIRHFPVDNACNPHAPRTMQEHACWAARAAQAAAQLYGNEGFWKMHAWLLDNQHRTSSAALRNAAEELGFDADELIRTMNSTEVLRAIETDARDAERQNIGNIPHLVVNRRRVPRWNLEGHDVLGTIFDEAAGE